MNANEELGTFVRVYWAGSGNYTEFPEATWDTFRSILFGNTLGPSLTMNTVLGWPIMFRTDQVATAMLSTPEAREAAYARDALWEQVQKQSETPQW